MVAFNSLTWGAPHLLFAALAFAIITIGLMFAMAYRTKKSLALLSHRRHQKRMLPHFSWMRLFAKIALLSVATISICIGILRPQITDDHKPEEQEAARDLIIAIDISRSMLSPDVKPNRLAIAQAKALQLIQLLQAERVALILFADHAFVQCPLTRDRAAVRMFINSLSGDILSGGSTNLSAPIALAAKLFKESGAQKTKLLLLLTDGEDSSGTCAIAQQNAQQHGIKVATLGIGSAEGGPIPILDRNGTIIGHEKDDKDAIIVSKCNDQALRSLTDTCGGVYCKAKADSNDDCTYIAQWVDRHEKELIGSTPTVHQADLTHITAWATVLFLVIAWAL